jgi:putative addiction module killer protein
MTYTIETTDAFEDWLSSLSAKDEALVLARLARIQDNGHFGLYKVLQDGLVELKWKNGFRVYFIKVSKNKIRILLGGTKHGQEKDIKKAKRMF